MTIRWPPKDDELSGFDSLYVQGRSSNIIAHKKSEFEEYLEEPLFPRTGSFNDLNWWKINSAKLSTLAKMARDILAIPATAVASKAAFSIGGRVIDESRSSMLPEIVEINYKENPFIDKAILYPIQSNSSLILDNISSLTMSLIQCDRFLLVTAAKFCPPKI